MATLSTYFRGGGLIEAFDLIVTDPPYGDGIGYGRNGKTILNNEDESINYKILPLLYKALKPDKSCYVFTNWKFEHKLRNFIEKETDFNIRMLICIVKKTTSVLVMGLETNRNIVWCLKKEAQNII